MDYMRIEDLLTREQLKEQRREYLRLFKGSEVTFEDFLTKTIKLKQQTIKKFIS